MIYFNINIRNPFWTRFESLWTRSGKTLLPHKYWEVQAMKDEELFRIEFEFTTRQDHAGVRLELGLLGYKIAFNIYDDRHWDHEWNCWVDHSKEST